MKNNSLFDGVKSRRKKYILCLVALAVIVLFLFCLNMTIGEKNFTLLQVINTLTGRSTAGSYIITKLRLPRSLAAIFSGIAFGVAGNIFQTLLRNPLASPDIIGVSSGSTAAAVYCILFLNMNRGLVSIVAVVAGVLTSVLIYRIAFINSFSANRLILVGIGAQSIFTAFISWMIMTASEYDVPTAMRWMNGNLNGIVTDSLPLLIIVVFTCLAAIICLRHPMVSLTLGDSYATILGIHVNLVRTALIVLSVVLIAFATAITGPIASIAFLSGPIAKRICGHNQANILSSGLVGAILVLAGDFVGQHLLYTRFPVGVITGLLGGPYLIYILVKQNKGGQF
ncbi:FecCD family ABC transporter permease [Pseudobutyrivibrio ruminis]|uniref:Iron ABC transporter n=1 Tax=Pseudobutyrivibrio ruminis TaxID=46206 RepID=A0A2G3DU85_9FIRM|nr:iron chelate uptake ABC transporter family permease subunit [Pseudobutyrivibrio ruminis]PHU34589.1 iron ABC transporter [Pseudobutyrivibrio ruminis]